MAKDKFLRGAFILTMAGLMVKVIGSVNRILLSRLLGGEGIGLYQMAYTFYTLLNSLSSAGVPVAISILVSQKLAKNDYGGAGRIFKISLSLMASVGLFFAIVLYFGAEILVASGIIRDGRAYMALIAHVPTVFFASILASFRGYFQGYQLMTPPAVSQIFEQLFRVITMLILAYWLLPQGLEYAAAGAAFGAVPGSIIGLLVLGFFYIKYRHVWQEKIRQGVFVGTESVSTIAMRLVKLALPVSAANFMLPLVSGIDMLMVPGRLEAAGFSVVEATTAFGYLTGMALPLIMLGTIPTVSAAASVVPAISEARALGDNTAMRDRGIMAIRMCFLVTVPAMFGMIALAGPISRLLYGTFAATATIAHLAPAVFFLGLYQVSTGLLQGIGMTLAPVLNMLAGIIVKILLVWVLTAQPEYNILGAAWASNVNFALAALLNIVILGKFTLFSFPRASMARIIAAAIVMALAARLVCDLCLDYSCGNSLAALVGIVAGASVYTALLILSGEFSKKELRKLPFLGKYIK